MTKTFRKFGISTIATALLVPGMARAGHIAPGTWTVTATVDTGAIVSQIPQNILAKLSAMGIALPQGSQNFSVQQCVTPLQAATDTPPVIADHGSGCAPRNIHFAGSTLTADLICTGRVQGKGSAMAVFSTPEHFTGTYSFTGSSHGKTLSVNNNVSGDLTSHECAAPSP